MKQSEYDAAIAEHNKAIMIFDEIRINFRGGNVTVNDFITAKQEYDKATAKFDAVWAIASTEGLTA